MKITNDFLNTETTKRPPTLVIVPRNKSTEEFLVDVKYSDFTGVLDIPKGYPKVECYIVPPYKHLMHVSMHLGNQHLSVYVLRGKTRTTHYPLATYARLLV